MKSDKLSNMTKGWFVGNFNPSVYKTNDVEVAVKEYKKGDFEDAHYHKIATEITVIQKGKVIMFDKEWNSGDIIIVEPYDTTSFKVLEVCFLSITKGTSSSYDAITAGAIPELSIVKTLVI